MTRRNPRCPEHDVPLTTTGTCTSCAGDHAAGDHEAAHGPCCPSCAPQAPGEPPPPPGRSQPSWTPSTCLSHTVPDPMEIP